MLAAIVALAGLDTTAVVLFKESAAQRNPLYAIYGIGLLICVAGVLIVTLDMADLTIVSLGWIVLFQVVVMGVDALKYGVYPGRLQAAAIFMALLGLIVAALAPSAEAEAAQRRGQSAPTLRAIPHQREPSLEEKLRAYIREKNQQP
jgi:uncharacterized membrane protein YidH (DUF202 family)